jgi:hypothetical protein
LNSIGDSLSHLEWSNNEKDGKATDDDEEDPRLGQLCKDDESWWVIGVLSNQV